ncbi:MAG TPA: MFS transporter [Aggregatilineaceae bacterium]|nr:MFS transporter [Aggregatilineaceae bacterium]
MRTLWRDIGRDTRHVMAAFMLWGIGEGLWMFIQPLYVKSLGATPAQTGFVIGMWGLARLLFILPAGILADRWRVRRLLLPGWYLGLAGVLLLALAPDWRWAAPGFLVYGISAIAIPMTNLYLTQAIRHDPTRRPDLPLQVSLTLLWAAYSAGIVITPAIGGWIGDHIGLRAVFFFSTFWFALSTLTIRRTHDYPAPERPEEGHDYRGALRQRTVLAAFGLLTLGFVAVLTGQTLSAQFLEEVRGFSRTSIGAFGSISALGTLVCSLALGRLAAWRGFYTALGLVLLAFGLLLVSGAAPVVVVATSLLGAYYTTRPLAVTVISGYVAEHQRGMAYALVDTLAGLATVIGTNLSGVLYGANPDWPYMAGMAGIVVTAVLGGLRVNAPRRRNVTAAAAYTDGVQSGD